MKLHIRNLPYPPRTVSGNKRGHSLHKAGSVKALRETGKLCALEAITLNRVTERQTIGVETAKITWLVFTGPRMRRMDDDNTAHACKSLRDGIADALKTSDGLWRQQEMHFDRTDRVGGYVDCVLEWGTP